MRDQRLDASEALAERAQAHFRQHGARGVERPQIERDERPEAAHLLFRELVLGMVGQARVEGLPNLRVGSEEAGDLPAIGLVPLHADGERLDPAQDEPGIHGRKNCARAVLNETEPIDQLEALRDDDSADGIGMAVQELRGRVHHQVGT
jgi:hypothetical protein